MLVTFTLDRVSVSFSVSTVKVAAPALLVVMSTTPAVGVAVTVASEVAAIMPAKSPVFSSEVVDSNFAFVNVTDLMLFELIALSNAERTETSYVPSSVNERMPLDNVMPVFALKDVDSNVAALPASSLNS